MKSHFSSKGSLIYGDNRMTVSHEIQEFLGDNVPDNTDADPGRLTDIRSALSATHVLHQSPHNIQLDQVVMHCISNKIKEYQDKSWDKTQATEVEVNKTLPELDMVEVPAYSSGRCLLGTVWSLCLGLWP